MHRVRLNEEQLKKFHHMQSRDKNRMVSELQYLFLNFDYHVMPVGVIGATSYTSYTSHTSGIRFVNYSIRNIEYIKTQLLFLISSIGLQSILCLIKLNLLSKDGFNMVIKNVFVGNFLKCLMKSLKIANL